MRLRVGSKIPLSKNDALRSATHHADDPVECYSRPRHLKNRSGQTADNSLSPVYNCAERETANARELKTVKSDRNLRPNLHRTAGRDAEVLANVARAAGEADEEP